MKMPGIFSREKEKDEPGVMTPEVAMQIVRDYGAVMESSAPLACGVADVRDLPHPKERIKQALILALRETTDKRTRDGLRMGYIYLADWQPGVGNPIRDHLGPWDSFLSLEGKPRRIAVSGDQMEKWRPVIAADETALKAELEALGLW